MKRKHIIIIALILITFGIVMRLLPHAPNMTPITALAFAGGLYLGNRWALILPLVSLFIADAFIGFYDWKIMLSVYGSFALIGVMSWVARKHRAVLPIGLSVIGSSLLFFIITNGAVWLFSPWYEKSIAGLLYAYELGLPFWRNMLAGDVVYIASLVAVFEVVRAIIRVFKNRTAVIANPLSAKS